MKSNLNISNLLTVFRIILVPFLVKEMFDYNWSYACLIFTIATLTDLFDGALARYLSQETILGSYLDPLADKILFLSCYISLVFINFKFWQIPRWFVCFVLFKELILILGSIYYLRDKTRIKPSLLGKFTTFLQSIFMGLLFLSEIALNLNLALTFFVYIIFILMVVTLAHYLYLGYREKI